MASRRATKIRFRGNRHANRTWLGTVAIFLFLGIVSVFMLLPLVYSVLNAFKPLEELYIYPPRFFVNNPTLQNFKDLLNLASGLQVPFTRYLFNNCLIALVVTFGNVIISSMIAFPLAKYKRLRLAGLFRIIVAALLFNGTVLWIPQYVIMAQLGIINTYWAYILPALPSAMGVFLMKQFMEQIPDALIESAIVDGASHWLMFWKIIMPQVKPAWLTLTVFAFTGAWNQALPGLVYDDQLKMLNDVITQITLGGFQRVGPATAGSLLMIVPPILLFLFTQNRVIETMAYSGIKE